MTILRRLLAFLIALCALAAVATVTRPSAPHRAGTTTAADTTVAPASYAAPVRVNVVCPDLRLLPGTLTSTIGVGAASDAAGSVNLDPAAGTTAGKTVPLIRSSGPISGQKVATYTGPLTGPLTISAAGPLSGSLVAEQASRGNKTTDRGWAEARCEPPAAVQWFIGAATQPGDTPTLELANPDTTTAVTTVNVLTPSGLVATSAAENIELSPNSVQYVPLSNLAPAQSVTAVEVVTETGQVSASIRDVRSSGETFLGTDYLPEGSASATVVVAGIPGEITGAPPQRLLYIADPDSTQITATVSITTPQGTYIPTGLNAVTVQPDTVATIDIGHRLGSEPGTVTVSTANPNGGTDAGTDAGTTTGQPIVAGVFVNAASTVGSAIHEITYLGSSQPLQGPALIPLNYASDAIDSVLIMSAPQGAVNVTITGRTGQHTNLRLRVLIPAGATTTVSLRAHDLLSGSAITVTPDPGSNPVYATRLIEEAGLLGPLISNFQLIGPPPEQPVLAVTPLPLGALR